MIDKLKVAIIGCGDMVYNFIYDCTKNLPIKLVSICDTQEEKLQRFKERYQVPKTYTDYKNLLSTEQLDAVICFPDNFFSHYEITKNCLLAGVHIFIERPQCLTIEQAKELLEIQQRTSAYAVARWNKRFTPGYMLAKEIVQREEFGQITMYLAKYDAGEYESDFSYVYKHIIHHLDLARYLMGEIVLTHVDTIKLSDKKVGYNISFKGANGAIGVIQSGSLQSAGYPKESVEITGIERNVVVDNIRSVKYNRPAPRRNASVVEPMQEGGDTLLWNLSHGNNSGYSFHGFENQISDFFSSLHAKKEPSNHLGDSIQTIELLHSLVSILENQKKQIAEFN